MALVPGAQCSGADEYGMIVQDYAYSPFGAPVQVMGGQVNPLQYTGEQWEETTGLLYLRAR